MDKRFAVGILEQFKEKPTLINSIETQEEAIWFEEALDFAIKALEQTNKVEESNYNLEQYKADLQGAYDCGYAKALEQEPCEDCVSRDEVFDLVADFDLDMNQVVKGIRALPSVTPQQKVGHWMLIHPLQENDDVEYICSNCNQGDWDCDTIYKYCPYCGVKMIEPQESEDKG